MTALWRHARHTLSEKPNEAGMKKKLETVEHTEPIGIIISSGERVEQPTVFSAYIWGPAPEPLDPASKAA